MEFSHYSVMLEECISGLAIRPDGIYVDGTAGGAGHSCQIAKRLTEGKLFALDKDPDFSFYRDDLFNVSHREYSTGFFYGHDAIDVNDIDRPTSYGYQREYLFLGTVKDEVRPGIWSIDIKNQLRKGRQLEYIGSDVYRIEDNDFTLLDADFNPVEKLDHGKSGYIMSNKKLKSGYIIRSEADIKTIN